MTEQEFFELARQGYNRIPLVREMPGDLETPLSVYLKLANAPYAYLLESVVGGERFGRYSFIGLPARTILRVRAHLLTVETDGGVVEEHSLPDPLAFIADFQARFKAAPVAGLPRFTGGLAGYFGYDTIRYIEKRLADRRKDDVLHTPDILLMLTEELAVFDNLAGKLYLITHADPMQQDAYVQGHLRLAELAEKLRVPVALPAEPPAGVAEPESEFGEAEFKAAVQKAKDYIAAGDVMQVVLSQRMTRPFAASPLSLYRALKPQSVALHVLLRFRRLPRRRLVAGNPGAARRRQRHPAPYRRNPSARLTREDDQRLAEELLVTQGTRRHLQLLDLGRNDTGRVAVTGSVRSPRTCRSSAIARDAHRLQRRGQARPAFPRSTCCAPFPGRHRVGAPKVRAMEIIDELEPSKRGIYAGAVGYLGFNGDMDLAIAIRTAVVKDGMLYAQAGAGIVADSVPDNEWMETLNKALAIVRAAELAYKAPHGR